MPRVVCGSPQSSPLSFNRIFMEILGGGVCDVIDITTDSQGDSYGFLCIRKLRHREAKTLAEI